MRGMRLQRHAVCCSAVAEQRVACLLATIVRLAQPVDGEDGRNVSELRITRYGRVDRKRDVSDRFRPTRVGQLRRLSTLW
jgi:hypothetical protein